MDKQERHEYRVTKIQTFEESAAAYHKSNIFGLPFSVEGSEVIIIPIPWEVTVSFRPGTAQGPEAIYEASCQVDLFDPQFGQDAWKYGFAMEHINENIKADGKRLRQIVLHYMHHKEKQRPSDNFLFTAMQQEVNTGCILLNNWLKEKSVAYLEQGKIVGVVGGDHSVPLGLMQALATHYGSYGILHIDAHYDHRDAFEGFQFSHASIMRNASRIGEIEKIVHVGIRDYCKEEADFVAVSPQRFQTFTDWDIACNQFTDWYVSWFHQCRNMIASLPKLVYISFDIDGLDPSLCPHTGTPVPGGLHFQQACFLLWQIVRSGRRIIGFDLCEVAPANYDWSSDWDANVGARILYRLCSLAATSSFGTYRS